MYDIGIIGGGTAGLTAAIYGQRAGKRRSYLRGRISAVRSHPLRKWKIIRVSRKSAARNFR